MKNITGFVIQKTETVDRVSNELLVKIQLEGYYFPLSCIHSGSCSYGSYVVERITCKFRIGNIVVTNLRYAEKDKHHTSISVME